MYHLLQSLRLSELNRATAVPGLNREDAYGLSVLLPPLNEQKRIVAKIESLQSRSKAAREALEAIPSLIEKYRQSVLAAAFRGDLTKEWREKNKGKLEPAEELLKRIRLERSKRWEDTELARMRAKGKEPKDDSWKAKYKEPEPVDTEDLWELPDGWCWAKAEGIGDVQLGRQRAPQYHSGPNMRPYLRVQNVFEDRIDISDVMKMQFSPLEYEIFKLKSGDILLNEGQSRELVGRPAIFRDELPGACFTNTLVRHRMYSGVLPEYALLLYRHYMRSRRLLTIGISIV